MERDKDVYSLSKGYSPFIYQRKNELIYCFPVSSGHADLTFDFIITELDLEVIKRDQFRFKALYFVVFYEAQSTFGTGHSNPRQYTIEEFECAKNIVLYLPEKDLKLYIKKFSKQKNLAEHYFQYFSKVMFSNV